MCQRSGQIQLQPHTAAVFLELFAGVQPETAQIAVERLPIPARPKEARHTAPDLCGVQTFIEKSVLKYNAELGAGGGVGRGAAQQLRRATVGPVDAAEQL